MLLNVKRIGGNSFRVSFRASSQESAFVFCTPKNGCSILGIFTAYTQAKFVPPHEDFFSHSLSHNIQYALEGLVPAAFASLVRSENHVTSDFFPPLWSAPLINFTTHLRSAPDFAKQGCKKGGFSLYDGAFFQLHVCAQRRAINRKGGLFSDGLKPGGRKREKLGPRKTTLYGDFSEITGSWFFPGAAAQKNISMKMLKNWTHLSATNFCSRCSIT